MVDQLQTSIIAECKGNHAYRLLVCHPGVEANNCPVGSTFMGAAAAFSRTGAKAPSGFHLNHESILPPVDCELLIAIPCWEDEPVLLRAIRPGFVENKDDDITYHLQQLPVNVGLPQDVVFIGDVLKGRFKWTYP